MNALVLSLFGQAVHVFRVKVNCTIIFNIINANNAPRVLLTPFLRENAWNVTIKHRTLTGKNVLHVHPIPTLKKVPKSVSVAQQIKCIMKMSENVNAHKDISGTSKNVSSATFQNTLI